MTILFENFVIFKITINLTCFSLRSISIFLCFMDSSNCLVQMFVPIPRPILLSPDLGKFSFIQSKLWPVLTFEMTNVFEALEYSVTKSFKKLILTFISLETSLTHSCYVCMSLIILVMLHHKDKSHFMIIFWPSNIL